MRNNLQNIGGKNFLLLFTIAFVSSEPAKTLNNAQKCGSYCYYLKVLPVQTAQLKDNQNVSPSIKNVCDKAKLGLNHKMFLN